MASRLDRSPIRDRRDVHDERGAYYRSHSGAASSSSHHPNRHHAPRRDDTRTPSPGRPLETYRDSHHRHYGDEEYDRERHMHRLSREHSQALNSNRRDREEEDYRRRQAQFYSNHYESAREEGSRRFSSDRDRKDSRHDEVSRSKENGRRNERREDNEEYRRRHRHEGDDGRHRDDERREIHYSSYSKDGPSKHRHVEGEDYYRHRSPRQSERSRLDRPHSRERHSKDEKRHRDNGNAYRESSRKLEVDARDAPHQSKIDLEIARSLERGEKRNGIDDAHRSRRDSGSTHREDRPARMMSDTYPAKLDLKEDLYANKSGKSKPRRRSTPTEDDVFEKLSSKNKASIAKPETQINGTERQFANEDKTVEVKRQVDQAHFTLSNGNYKKNQVDKYETNRDRIHVSSDNPTRSSSSHNQYKPAQKKSLVDRVFTSPTPPRSPTPPSLPNPQASAHLDSLVSAPQKEETAVKPSYHSVKLPHELLEPENEGLIPLRPDGKRLLPFRVTYDPKLDKSGKGKDVIKTVERDNEVSDPRKGRKSKRPARKQVRILTWPWDIQSTKAKPPPPPSAICISHLSPLITMVQVKPIFRNFGRIERTELKLDPKTGESLGVAFIKYVQDYDEDGNLREESRQMGQDQNGHEVARKVMNEQSTIRIGDGKDVKLAFDDDDQSTFLKEWKGAMERKHGTSSKLKSKSAENKLSPASMDSGSPISGIGKGSNGFANMLPPPTAPKALRQQMAATGILGGAQSSHPNSQRNGYGFSPKTSASMNRSAVMGSALQSHIALNASIGDQSQIYQGPHAHRASGFHGQGRLHPYNYPRSSFDASPIVKSPLHSSDQAETLQETSWIMSKLADVGNPYIFIRKLSQFNAQLIIMHFQAFSPIDIFADASGWYLSFDNPLSARRSSQIITSINGVPLTLYLRDCPRTPHRQVVKRHSIKTSWHSPESLKKDCHIIALRSLGNDFMRESRKKIIKPYIENFIKADSVGGQALLAKAKSDILEAAEESEEDVEDDMATSTVSGDRIADSLDNVSDVADSKEISAPTSVMDEEEEIPMKVKRGRKSKKVVKTEVGEAVDEIITQGADEEVIVELKKIEVAKPKVKKMKKKQAIREKSPIIDPFASGLAEDDEDLYYIKIALQKMQEGQSISDIQFDAVAAIEATEEQKEGMGVNGLPRHSSGSARTQGFYRIPPAEKALHLPDRNRAVVDPSSAVGMASARDNRADSRRFVQGIEQHKKETATDTDILKFNQLRSRKKQLKFAKSPIHDWGLYAMELIPAGDMVIEYVGEIVRQQVADQREKNYERQGNFSTYLFRVDDDVVVDATKKGNIARLMNHCCTPNCNAKILTLNGEKRIVLFAKNTILPGQELTYDYKFQATGDEEDAIACLCGSSGCRRFL